MRRFAYICAGVLVFTGSAVADYRDDCKDYENPDKAIRACTVLLQLQPQNAVVYAHRGSAYITKKDYDSALRDFDAAIRIDTRQPAFIYSLRGAAHQGRREYDLAIAEFQRVGDYFRMGEAYRRKGDLTSAARYFERAKDANPNDATSLVQLALLADGSGKRDEAKSRDPPVSRFETDDTGKRRGLPN